MDDETRVAEIRKRVEARAQTALEGWASTADNDIVCAQSRADMIALLEQLRTAEADQAQTEGAIKLEMEAAKNLGRHNSDLTAKLAAAEVRAASSEAEADELLKRAAALYFRAAEAEAIIAEAPHTDICQTTYGRRRCIDPSCTLRWKEQGSHGRTRVCPDAPDRPCDCWKSTDRPTVLARVKAEAKAEALLEEAERISGYTLDHRSATSMFDHILRLIKRDAQSYQAGADQ